IQNYAHAPYLYDHLDFIKELFQPKWEKLLDLNLTAIGYLANHLEVKEKLVLQSSLEIKSYGSDLLVEICKSLKAEFYLTPKVSEKYLNLDLFLANGITVKTFRFNPPIYPQLGGKFIFNLSLLDLMLNCGNKSLEIIKKFNKL
ncbi:MAG: WbqC family protein, partial [Desulfobacterota bacterium]|nr:WbqC family protein [Thermodesulfobacteriota bacterium]